MSIYSETSRRTQSPLWGRTSRILALMLLGFSLCIVRATRAAAQDIPFNPRTDAIGDEKPKKEKTPVVQQPVKHHPVYSFARWGLVFKDLCVGLESDGRQARIYEITKKAMTEELSCTSCRALYRQLSLSCAPKVPPKLLKKKAPSPVPTDTPVAEGEGGVEAEEPSSGENAEGGDSSETETPVAEATAQPSSTPQPQAARNPRTEVIDAASRISMGLYDMEPGIGSTFKALQNFETRLLAAPNLTAAEKDYYGVLLSYLQSAWEGRPGSPLDPRVKAKEDVSVLFQ